MALLISRSAVSGAIRWFIFKTLLRALAIQGFPDEQIALACVIAAVTGLNYLGSKLWAFK
jgi:hypothetical protein